MKILTTNRFDPWKLPALQYLIWKTYGTLASQRNLSRFGPKKQSGLLGLLVATKILQQRCFSCRQCFGLGLSADEEVPTWPACSVNSQRVVQCVYMLLRMVCTWARSDIAQGGRWLLLFSWYMWPAVLSRACARVDLCGRFYTPIIMSSRKDGRQLVHAVGLGGIASDREKANLWVHRLFSSTQIFWTCCI